MPTKALDIPVTAPFTLATMEHSHARFEVTPDNDRTLSFDLALPKHWAHSKEFGPVMGGLLQERGLGFFTASLEADAPVVAVTVTSIPFEVPVDTWIRLSLEREGWEVVTGRWFPGPNGLFFDITATRNAEGLPLVRRTSARVDGTDIFCVNTMCGLRRWDMIKEDFWTAHVTFALLGASGSSRMETWVRASTISPDFETVHPITWFSEPAESNVPTTSGIHIRLADAERETLLAYLLIRAERKPKDERAELIGLVADAVKLIETSGTIFIAPLRPQRQEEDPRSLAVPGWVGGYIGDATLRGADVLVRIGFVERDDALVTLVLYSPRIDDDVLSALRAQRAFEIARDGLTLGR